MRASLPVKSDSRLRPGIPVISSLFSLVFTCFRRSQARMLGAHSAGEISRPKSCHAKRADLQILGVKLVYVLLAAVATMELAL
jgi:hypothetical protein